MPPKWAGTTRLIDSGWDKQIGYERMKELVDYARSKGVGILVWYNSAGDWNDAPQTPRNRMLTHESRIQEFDRLKPMGVAGLKIDFFGGDGQSMIDYYLDILHDAAPYGFADELPRRDPAARLAADLSAIDDDGSDPRLRVCDLRAVERRRGADARGDAAVHAKCF